MRITGGELRGRTISAPRGMAVRPTTDKVRQSIFNILAHEIPEAKVIDLFCGCGSLGLEALSRGAESVVFVDVSEKSIRSLQQNLKSLDLKSEVIQADWHTALNKLRESGRSFDLVFADPPYHDVKPEWIARQVFPDALKTDRDTPALLGPEGILIIESEADAPPVESARLLKERTFGQTKVSFYTHLNPVLSA